MPRRTIESPVTFSGIGLHTGVVSTVRLTPGDSLTGIRFRRTDLVPAVTIPATVEHVTTTERRTVIGSGGAEIHTVEHLLSAVFAHDLDDLLIEIDGPEVPILDGSFAPLWDLLHEAGVRESAGEPRTFTVEEAFDVSVGEAVYAVTPNPTLRLTATIEWDHPLIGCQKGSFDILGDSFRTDVADARTFGFTRELDSLRAKGLLKGASVDTALVLDETSLVHGSLRFYDEFLRHKVGDILGDLGLLGGRIKAHIIATRPSHHGNVVLARQLARRARSTGGTTMDITQITAVLPHRFPFLLVDRILSVGKDHIVGIKNVTINEPFFQGHFPGHPIMPGVLIVESMAQVGGMLVMEMVDDPSSKVVYFMALDDVKFRRPVVPGDQLRCEVTLLQNRGKTCKMRGEAFVEGQLVCEAVMMARVVDR